MKNVKTFKQFLNENINEARAIAVTLEPKDFNDPTSLWGIYQPKGNTGNVTNLRMHSNYFIDMEKENNPDERDVIYLGLDKYSDGRRYLGIGLINNLKRTNAGVVGKYFPFSENDDIDEVSKEASKFLFDKDHFTWINKKIKAEGKKLRVKPKGDFSGIIKELILAAQ